MILLTVSVLLLLIHQNECFMNASAVLYGDNSMTSYGTLTFTQDDADTFVHITGTLIGLNASSAHGFHVHTYPVSEGSPNCTTAGGHLNPYNTPHGPPTANITSRHVGDLGNITTDINGTADVNIQDWIIQLYNETQSIINRTVVVHLYRDDGGQGGFPDSNTTGNAGPRILCGLINLSADNVTTTEIPTTTTQTSITTTTEISTTTTQTSITTTTETPMTTTQTSITTPSVGLNIQTVMFVLFITMIVDYIFLY